MCDRRPQLARALALAKAWVCENKACMFDSMPAAGFRPYDSFQRSGRAAGHARQGSASRGRVEVGRLPLHGRLSSPAARSTRVRPRCRRMILAPPQCGEKWLQAPASDAPHGACCAGVRGDLTRRWCGEGGRIRACGQRKNGSGAALRTALSGQGDLVNPNPKP